MGVPAFYRWLVSKYPKIVVNVMEDNTCNDITLPNPNALEFHNLYLDMNGIIHPCFHPSHSPICPPTTFDHVFDAICAYIDRLVSIVRPRKLLYLAIDGVAPRAKMNQQRSRRFRTAKDNELAEEEEKRLREEFERKGKKLVPKLESQLSDSNVITPGTYFMQELSNALSRYICDKLKNDPGWSQLEVILSDATVPGEGEHKIISFIRSKRSLPDYDPNTRHCLYGLDADLIMLALATHEVHFSILRENVLEEAYVARSKEDKDISSFDIQEKKHVLNQPQHFQFLHIWILREYLELDMQIVDPPEKFVFDLERIIDDFIFICFFVGNDFLPHMPTLEIHEKAIDLLMHVYKKEFKSLGGYLVDMQRAKDLHAGYIKLKRVEKFILVVGTYEEQIFKKRTEIRDRKLRRILSQLSELEAINSLEQDFACIAESAEQNHSSSDFEEVLENTKELNETLKACIRAKCDVFKDGNVGTDKVKLGSLGWKERYYKYKFSVEDSQEVERLRKELVQNYTEGLCWVLLYYFSGIPSWNWYYHYHYGPFASDLRGLASVKVEFEKGLPFKPFDQLMAVLPPKSAHALPKVYQELMTNSDSDIFQFYPTDFEVDVDGKRFLWQGVCKLPFIEQEKLLNATRLLEEKVEEYEGKRNVETTHKMFSRVSLNSGLGEYLLDHKEIEDGIMCFNFELPVACVHTPRLLEGVELPQKIVFENDIMETVLWHEDAGRMPFTRNRSSSVDVGKHKVNENSAHKFGRGFGRGKTITTNWNEMYCPVHIDGSPQNVNRSMSDLRISTSCDNELPPYEENRNSSTHQNSFYPRFGFPSNEGRGTRPCFSSQGSRGFSDQVRPYNANLGRGRGPPMAHLYSQQPSFSSQGRGVSSGQVRPCNANLGRGRGPSRAQPSFSSQGRGGFSDQFRPYNANLGRGRGPSRAQMYSQYSSFSSQGSGGSSGQVRPYNANVGRGRGPFGAQMYNEYPRGKFLDIGRGRGGAQMNSQ